jgi:hypothetical protein
MTNDTQQGRPAEKTKRTNKAPGLTVLERNILISKGLTEQEVDRLVELGVKGKSDLRLIGDAGTLAEFGGLCPEVAEKVMNWALGSGAEIRSVVVQSGDLVLCVHCGAKQPKDYKSGDLCIACGKQAEPIMACYWCGAIGPGKFCRQCGAEFVPTAELELAILLKREGVAKGDIPEQLRKMDRAEKDVLWGRARRYGV